MYSIVSTEGAPGPQVIEAERPTPGPGEVLVKVHASTVNLIDAMVTSSEVRAAMGLSGTVGLGWDVAGEIVDANGLALAVGTRVAGLHDSLGSPSAAHAEFVALPVEAVAAIPQELDAVSAATVPLNALTAQQGLAELGDPAGRSLLVTGAAGAVGGYAIALARTAGWSQVIGLARTTDREFVESAGAEFAESLPGSKVDAIFDPAVLGAAAMDVIVDGGGYVGVMPVNPAPAVRNISATEIMVHHDGLALGALLELAAGGELAVRIDAKRQAASEASPAWERLSQPGVRGRQVLVWEG